MNFGDGLVDVAFVSVLLAGGVRAATPLILASLGECYAERSGVLNLGLEGMMLAGALGGFLAAFYTASLWTGFGVGLALGAVLGLVVAYLTVTLKLNQIVVGLGVTVLSSGMTSFLFRDLFGRSFPMLPVTAPVLAVPLLRDVPLLGAAVFEQQPLVYVALLMVPVLHMGLFHTTFGLNMRAVGESPFSADALGVDVFKTRYVALMVAGALGGLGGAFMSIGDLAFFIPGMTRGQGFIAIAITMLSKWRPAHALLGALVFGVALSLSTGLQAMGVDVQSEFILMLPYIGIVVAMVLLARHSELPAALGRPYERGER